MGLTPDLNSLRKDKEKIDKKVNDLHKFGKNDQTEFDIKQVRDDLREKI